MRLSGYQPQYFPRLHYFARMLESDIFRIIDYVQFVRAHLFLKPDGSRERGFSYQAHTPIKLSSGLFLLSVPTEHRGLTAINTTTPNSASDWVQKHIQTIRYAYAKSKNAAVILPHVNRILSRQSKSLAELNILSTYWALSHILGSPTENPEQLTTGFINDLLVSRPHPFRLRKIVVMSETDILPRGENEDPTDWIIMCTKRLGADEYYHGGTAAAAYLDENRLRDAGIAAVQQNWICKEYRQLHPRVGFLPNLSILDLLLNENLEQVQEILLGTRHAQKPIAV